MLYLNITGKASRRRCKDIIEWFKSEYLPNHHISIDVVHRGMKREQAYGYCSVQDCDYRPRDFLIELETTLPEELYIQTLLHELWHMYQHVIGILRDKRGVRHWKNFNSDNLDYEDQPWEHEAIEMEVVLYNDYMGTQEETPHFFPNRLTNS
jgi:hypothetical protein